MNYIIHHLGIDNLVPQVHFLTSSAFFAASTYLGGTGKAVFGGIDD
jgi:hypothetical protein